MATNWITIKSTGERIRAYRLKNGNYFDFDSMSPGDIPKSRTNKKEFTKEEITIGEKIEL